LNLGSARQPANPEAEDFYLKGRFYWNQRTIDSLNKALDSFTQAIVHDPSYAPAYVGLADCYNLLREYSVMPADEAYPRALAAAKKALELDDQSSEAHASLAFVSFNWMLDAATADREFRRAIELDPKNSVAYHWYATTLVNLARYPESIAEIEHAQALDPASKSILADKGRILWSAGRHDEALSLLKQMETAEPGFMSPHRYLRLAYLDSGDYPDYLAEMKQEALLRHDDAALSIAEAAAMGFSSGGTKGMFREQLREREKYYALGQVSPVALAETSALLGNTSRKR
jgi:tetratricopeptide (TPR) repeat protein